MPIGSIALISAIILVFVTFAAVLAGATDIRSRHANKSPVSPSFLGFSRRIVSRQAC